MLSRARFPEKLWILRAFGPGLFRRGPPAGQTAGSSGGVAGSGEQQPSDGEDAAAGGDRQPLTIRQPTAAGDGETQYDVNPLAESRDVVFFPELVDGPQLRRHWYMRRRRRPMVPAPSHTPLPDKQPDGEGKAKLFSLYMRPWVLDRRFATADVPHLADLDLVPGGPRPAGHLWRPRCQSPARRMARRVSR